MPKPKAKNKSKAKSEGETSDRRGVEDGWQVVSDSEKKPKAKKKKKVEKKPPIMKEKKSKSKLKEKRKTSVVLKKKKSKVAEEEEEEETEETVKEEEEPEEITQARAEGRLGKYVADVIVEGLFERTWAICSERFYNREAPYLIARELRNAFHRMIQMNFMDELYERGTGGGKRLFNEDDPPLPLSLDTWSRGALELFPRSKRESVMDPFLRTDLYTPISNRRRISKNDEESRPFPSTPVDSSKKDEEKFFPPIVPSNSFASFSGEGEGNQFDKFFMPQPFGFD